MKGAVLGAKYSDVAGKTLQTVAPFKLGFSGECQ